MSSAKRVRRSRAKPEPKVGPKAAGGVRERILDAAVALLRESGLQRFTQVQVAERAGVRQSHLTYYFPTRENLLDAVTARAVEGVGRGVPKAGAGQEPPDRGSFLEGLAASIADPEHMRMFLGLIVEADGDPAVRDVLAGGARQMEAVLADALGGDDAAERARLVLAALWGLGLFQFLVRPPPQSDPTRPYLSWLAAAAGVAPPGGGKVVRQAVGRSRTTR